jgi:hypothetical protein
MVSVERPGRLRVVGVGLFVALWAFADGLIIGLPVLGATIATGRPMVVYAVGALVYALLNLGVCRWLDDQWDTWVVGSGFETRLLKLRDGKRARGAVAKIERGTARGYGVAAALLSASQVVALHRVITGEPTEPHERTIASVVPALLYPALYALVGWVVYRQV